MSDPREFSRPTTFSIALFLACFLLTGIASATPSITLSKKSGPPTSGIAVSGRGFKPNVGVDIYFDTKDKALVVTNREGEFKNAKIHVPRGARPGRHWVTALERTDQKGAQKPFLVRTDWPLVGFNDARTGLNPYENALGENTVGGLNLAWSYKTGGQISSSPAVVDGVLYFGSSDGNLYALHANTGDLLWKYPTGGAPPVGSSPTVADGVVYFISVSTLYALNARTGRLLWSKSEEFSLSPAVTNGLVYINSGQGLEALDAKSGAVRWSTTIPADSPAAVTNGVVYVGGLSGEAYVYAVDASTGSLLWQSTSYTVYGLPVPAVANGVVYFSTCSVCDGDGNVNALNATTGAVLWAQELSYFEDSPAIAAGIVYVAPENWGSPYLFALYAETGNTLWEHTMNAFAASSPVIANGVVYVGSEDFNIYALSARTGAPLWQYTTGNYVVASPAVANGFLYAASGDSNLYAFSLRRNSDAEISSSSIRPDLKTLRPDFNLKVSKR
jgi:eukaryotic-like serine/threonine-protein kinase